MGNPNNFVDYLGEKLLTNSFLVLLILLGLTIRVYFSLELSLWHDEAVTANSIISFLENGVPGYPSGFEYWRSFTSWIIPASLGAVFGTSEIVLRFPSIIYSTVMIPLVYKVGKEFYNRNVGLIAAIFTSVSAWQLSFATQIRMYALFQLLYFLTFYMIYKTGENASAKNIIATLFLTLWSMTVHITGYIIPVTGATYLAWRWKLHKNIKNLNKRYLAVITGFMISALILNEYYFTILGRLETLVFNPSNLSNYFKMIIGGFPVIWVLGLTGLLITREKKKIFLLNSLAILPPFYIYLLHLEFTAMRYLFYAMPFLTILTGLTIEKIAEDLKHTFKPSQNIYIILIPLTIILLIVGGSLNYGFEGSSTRPTYEQENAYNYIESNHQKNEDKLITQWTPPAIYYYKSPDAVMYPEWIEKDERFLNGSEKHAETSIVIRNKSELISYMDENVRGWVVLRDNSYRGQKEGIKELLSELEKTRFDEVNVWNWNSTSLNRYSKN